MHPKYLLPFLTALTQARVFRIPELLSRNVHRINNRLFQPHALSDGDSPTSGGVAMIKTINDYRAKAGLPLQQWDSKLAANAAAAGRDGKKMAHLMLPGTGGQVLAPGIDDANCPGRSFAPYTPFEVYYKSWLCEVPSAPGLDGKCKDILANSRINAGGQTGHWEILSDGKGKKRKYTRIGCAFTPNKDAKKCAFLTGIWACDLA